MGLNQCGFSSPETGSPLREPHRKDDHKVLALGHSLRECLCQ